MINYPKENNQNLINLTKDEFQQILLEWNNTQTDYPQNLCIHELFTAQLAKNPEQIAVIFNNQTLTYQQLNHQANKIAHYLQSLGVQTEDLIGICLDRSLEMVVGLLGILKVGAAYVPLDPSYPLERLSFMVADSKIKLLLTQQKFITKFTGEIKTGKIKTICLDQDWEFIDRQKSENIHINVTSENLAYVIYTSGSTGKPKGVAVPHRAINRLVCNTNYVEIETTDRIAQAANISFDAATFEIWVALINGATLIGINQNILLSPHNLYTYIQEQKINILFLTTALFNKLANLYPQAFANLKYLLVGGETIDPQSVDLVLKNGAPENLLNVYGPTESTTFASWYLVKEVPKGAKSLPIGQPISNTQIYILDEQLNPVHVNTPGELYIGGDGLARGYLNRPELTNERFINHSFKNAAGINIYQKIYKTGDLARYLADGNIEFLGRIDNQVKIRGFRIELGEIETLLNQHPEVYQAVVIVREDIPGDKRIVGYVVPQQQAKLNYIKLNHFLAEKLPSYMMPSSFMFLVSLPLTPNGKIDRRNLPVPNRIRPDLETVFVAPRNDVETRLTEIWVQLLGLDIVGVNDNFFCLGGHSLIVTQMLSRIREVFAVDLSFHQIFINPTITAIAELISQGEKESKWQRPTMKRIPRHQLLPASFSQERIYFVHQLAPKNSAYQFQATIGFKGSLNVAVLERCLHEIVNRHEIFRTTYQDVNGKLYQIIQPNQGISFDVVDLREIPESEREKTAEKLVKAEIQTHLDMTKLPIIKWVIFKLSDNYHILTHVEHHLAHDGWSFNIFLRELVELYQAFCAGQSSPLSDLSFQFVDFAHWQRDWAKTAEAEAQLNYWRQKLANLPPLLELPYDRPRPQEQTYNGDHLRMELPVDLCTSLRVFSHQEGKTLFMTMLTAFIVLLQRYTGEDDIFVGSAVANRRMQEIENIIGMIVNNVVLRTDTSGNPTVRELLNRVCQVTMEAYANEDVPFDQVVEAIKPVRNLSHNPLFQVMFSFHNSAKPHLHFPGLDVTLKEPASNNSAKFDLDFLVIPRFEQSVQDGVKTGAKGITLVLEYNSDLFDAETIEAMLEQYQKLLIEMVKHPELEISKLSIITTEQEKLLRQWNQTFRENTEIACIHNLFAAQVELTPGKVAVEQNGIKLTYQELSDRANQVAHYLQSLGVKPETLVGICVDRSLDMMIGLLGILKAGGAYVPLDPDYPDIRLVEIIEDTKLRILLTESRFKDKLPNFSGKLVCLDTEKTVISQCNKISPINNVQLDNLAYVIYTSGSTGKPKGVMIEHQSIVNFVTAAIEKYGITAGDRVLQFASVCFDTSIEEIFPCLCVGATLVLRNTEMVNSSEGFWYYCQQWQLTILDLPTTFWHQLVTELKPDTVLIPNSLKTVIIGGEAVQLEKIQHWYNCLANRSPMPQLFNSYGPTEAAVVTTLNQINYTNYSVSIGKPINNVQVYVLDENLQTLPIGVYGELYIGGAGLARGYWQSPELTAEKFIYNHNGDRLYKTGDLVRFRKDGNLEYLGRVDNQVKIRGFRIELGEIETVLRQHPQVSQAVVIANEDVLGRKRLVAYLVTKNSSLKITELREFLQDKLPHFMIPAAFMVLETLPMTANQKVDYHALPKPDFTSLTTDRFIAPRTLIEEELVEIWSEVLRVENVGIHDNFFALGGDSILSIQLISKAHQAGLKITAKQLFKYQTIAELATVAEVSRKIHTEQDLVTGKVSLTPIQKWFFEQNLPQAHYFNQSVLLAVNSEIQIDLLNQSFQELLSHHDALRLRFVQYQESWEQVHYHIEETGKLQVFDISNLTIEEEQKFIINQDQELQASLDFKNGKVFNLALFQVDKKRPSYLLFIVHHLVVDGVSWRILLEDLTTAYQQISQGEKIKFPAKTTSWKYWSERLQEYAQTEAIKELDYWLNQGQISVKELPTDNLVTQQNNTISKTTSVTLKLNNQQTTALLKNIHHAYNTQINDILLTALIQSFYQWTGEKNLLIDLEGHGREDLFNDVDLSRTVGWFTTLFPIALQLSEKNDIGENIKSIKEQLINIPKRGIGYGILRYLHPDNSIREKLQNLPVAQVSFNYLGQFDQVLTASKTLGTVTEFKSEQSLLNQRSHLIGISGFIRDGKLEMTWNYSDEIHKRENIDKLAVGFMEALDKIIIHCQSQDLQSYTPSDFSVAKLNQKQLDKFLSKIQKN